MLVETFADRVATVPSRSVVGLILDLDPELGAGVRPEEMELARSACRGEVVRVPSGAWDVPGGADERDDLLGFVIIEGLVCREVTLWDRYMFELLGPGDVLQLPVLAARPRLGSPIRLTAAIDTVLVALDDSYVRAAAQWPSLLATVHRRLEAQRERLAIQGLIAHLPRAEHRLLLTLWHLADRCGRVIAEGTLLPLPLTHAFLGQLTAARRPTVTRAVSALESEGYIRRIDDRAWLLTDAAAHKVAAITETSASARSLGETFIFPRPVAEIRHQSRGLRPAGEAGAERAGPVRPQR